jgi:single-stranded DNA-binding protein
MNYQRIIVVGNATQDAQVKESEKGEFVLLSVASKNRSGKSMYFPVFAAGRAVEYVKEVKKGEPVLVDGSVELSEYQPEGKEKRVELRIYADVFRRLSQKVDTEKAVKEELGAEEIEE